MVADGRGSQYSLTPNAMRQVRSGLPFQLLLSMRRGKVDETDSDGSSCVRRY